jgi:hypothetical protein
MQTHCEELCVQRYKPYSLLKELTDFFEEPASSVLSLLLPSERFLACHALKS